MRFIKKGEFKLSAPSMMGVNNTTVVTTMAAVSTNLDNTSYSGFHHNTAGSVSNIVSTSPDINPIVSISSIRKGATKNQSLELCYKWKSGVGVLTLTNTKGDIKYNYYLE